MLADETSPVFLERRLRDHRLLLHRPRGLRPRVHHRRGHRLGRPRRPALHRRPAPVPPRLRGQPRAVLAPGARRRRREAPRRRERGRRRLRPRCLDDHPGQGVRALVVRRATTSTAPRSRRPGRRPSRPASSGGPASRSASAQDFPGTGYDLACMFDCLHDMGDPVGAARRVRESLAEDGTLLLVEPAAGERLEDNLNPVSRLYYGLSTVICTPSSRSPGGRARARRPGRPEAARGGAARGRLLARAGRHADAVQPDHRGQGIAAAPSAASSCSPRSRSSPPSITRVRAHWYRAPSAWSDVAAAARSARPVAPPSRRPRRADQDGLDDRVAARQQPGPLDTLAGRPGRPARTAASPHTEAYQARHMPL